MVDLDQILAGDVIMCLEPLLNCQCHSFERLDLTVTEINIKKKYRNKT